MGEVVYRGHMVVDSGTSSLIMHLASGSVSLHMLLMHKVVHALRGSIRDGRIDENIKSSAFGCF